MKNKIMVWQCRKCRDVVVSDSRIHHKLDFCICGKCAIDLEQGYHRIICDKESDIKIILEHEF
jgi:hypothetical protein